LVSTGPVVSEKKIKLKGLGIIGSGELNIIFDFLMTTLKKFESISLLIFVVYHNFLQFFSYILTTRLIERAKPERILRTDCEIHTLV
jgi:hypothetical protein